MFSIKIEDSDFFASTCFVYMILNYQILKPMHIVTSNFVYYKLGHWSPAGQTMILHTQEMLYMSKEFYYFLLIKEKLCQNCESLNVKVTPHNDCNHRSMHLWLQSLELRLTWSLPPNQIGKSYAPTMWVLTKLCSSDVDGLARWPPYWRQTFNADPHSNSSKNSW